MKAFKPQMKDGMGEKMSMSPEAHKEWNDSEGKHSAMGMAKIDTDKYQNEKSVGPDGFDPGKGVKGLEAADKKKSHEAGNHGPFGGGKGLQASIGHKTGVQKHAGKGEEGRTKGPGGAGKVNYGNGIKPGKAMKGLIKGGRR